MTALTPKQTALEFLSAIKDRDIKRVDAVLADDGVFWVIGDLPVVSGAHNKESFMAAINILFATMEGPPTINVEDITAEDDRVSITAKGDMLTKTGTSYCNTYHFLETVQDGKIIRHKEYFDTQLVAKAFGL